MSNRSKLALDPNWPDAVIVTGSFKLGWLSRLKYAFKLMLFGKIEFRAKTPVSKPVKTKEGELSIYFAWPLFIENWISKKRTEALAAIALAKQGQNLEDAKKALTEAGEQGPDNVSPIQRGFRGKLVN
jgi:hypothetical protein